MANFGPLTHGRSQNFLKGDKRESGGQKSPSGVQGQRPGGGLGAKPQKPEKHSKILEMWANAKRDGRPAEYRWRPLFNAAKVG